MISDCRTKACQRGILLSKSKSSSKTSKSAKSKSKSCGIDDYCGGHWVYVVATRLEYESLLTVGKTTLVQFGILSITTINHYLSSTTPKGKSTVFYRGFLWFKSMKSCNNIDKYLGFVLKCSMADYIWPRIYYWFGGRKVIAFRISLKNILYLLVD